MAESVWASVIGTVRGESPDRMQRMLDRVAAQAAPGPVEVVLAAPAEDHSALGRLTSSGAVTRVVVVDNPGGARSTGLNLAARQATAHTVHRVDARSLLAPDHLVRCHARLASDPSVGVVGGRQRPVAEGDGVVARGIARALANPWVLGAPAYRRGNTGAQVDTVYLGAFRRDELLDLGGFDERLDANEDFDLCQRYQRSGALVWLEHGLVVDYEARAALVDVWRQYEAFGRAKVRYWRLRGERPNTRQLAGLAAPGAAAAAGVVLAPRPTRLLGAAAAAAAGLVVLDHVAFDEPAPFGVRAVATAAAAMIPSAWAAGAYREFLAGR